MSARPAQVAADRWQREPADPVIPREWPSRRDAGSRQVLAPWHLPLAPGVLPDGPVKVRPSVIR
ncbi:hypothetical protein GCM10010271_69460 [Streptomyces kurssanovii]|nr:hypothetical protein GCM10010271_69460 [Streptomyces kurssanovii]